MRKDSPTMEMESNGKETGAAAAQPDSVGSSQSAAAAAAGLAASSARRWLLAAYFWRMFWRHVHGHAWRFWILPSVFGRNFCVRFAVPHTTVFGFRFSPFRFPSLGPTQGSWPVL